MGRLLCFLLRGHKRSIYVQEGDRHTKNWRNWCRRCGQWTQ